MEHVNDDVTTVYEPYPSQYFPGRMVRTIKEENDEWAKKDEERCRRAGVPYFPRIKPPAPCLTWAIQYRKLLDKYQGRPIHQLMALAKLSRMMGIWRRVDEESGYYRPSEKAVKKAMEIRLRQEALRRFSEEKKQERENRKLKRKKQGTE